MYSNRAIRFTHIFVSCLMVSAAFLPGTALAAESKDAISISSALQLHLIESSGSYVFERDIELPKGDAWQLPDDFTGSFSCQLPGFENPGL